MNAVIITSADRYKIKEEGESVSTVRYVPSVPKGLSAPHLKKLETLFTHFAFKASDSLHVSTYVRESVCVCMCVCESASVCVCVCMSTSVCAGTF